MMGISRYAWLGLLLLTLLSYFQFPGNTYLESDTQIYLPMFERFRDPSLLARDPMVVRAHTSFTLYDELTAGLAWLGGLDFEPVLRALHLAARLALLAGVFLITRAMGLSELPAFACAGVYGLGGWVYGPSVLLVEYEPVPRALALGPLLLGVGLAAHERYLASGVAGAAAFLLHPTTAAPFWIVYVARLFVPDEPAVMKARLQALAPLAAAVVGLKIAASLQPGVTEPQAFFGRLDAAWEKLVRLRASYVYVSLWPRLYFWQYGLMLVAAAAAYCRLRRFLQPGLRFYLAGLAALGLASLPLSYLFLERLEWAMMPQLQPLRAILFLELFTMLLALVMAFELGCREGKWIAAGWWAAAGFAVGLYPRLLFVLLPPAIGWLAGGAWRALGAAAAAGLAAAQPFGLIVWRGAGRSNLLLALGLGALLAAASALWLRRPKLGAAAMVALTSLAFFLIPGSLRRPRAVPELDQLARWARATAPRDAVFLFPEAGRGSDPSVFRARSARAVYADWKGGGQINFFREFPGLWWSRWTETMERPFHAGRLTRFRELGIDYVVLNAQTPPPGGRLVFENSRYRVYDLR